MSSFIDVQLRAEWITGVGYRYDILLDGEVILARSRDPEHDTARILQSRGLRGQFRIIDFTTGRLRMTLDIEKVAKLCVVERDRGGLRTERYRPFGTDARTALHAPPVDQGWPFGFETAQGTGQPLPAAGDETAEAPALAPGGENLLSSDDAFVLGPKADTAVPEEA
ncbi:MAG: hypothetical protein KDK07_22290 [Bauldia sp.]|nr:hypothetical protein [Bauldia sp.]